MPRIVPLGLGLGNVDVVGSPAVKHVHAPFRKAAEAEKPPPTGESAATTRTLARTQGWRGAVFRLMSGMREMFEKRALRE
jgi:hypothetical protein